MEKLTSFRVTEEPTMKEKKKSKAKVKGNPKDEGDVKTSCSSLCLIEYIIFFLSHLFQQSQKTSLLDFFFLFAFFVLIYLFFLVSIHFFFSPNIIHPFVNNLLSFNFESKILNLKKLDSCLIYQYFCLTKKISYSNTIIHFIRCTNIFRHYLQWDTWNIACLCLIHMMLDLMW